ncbi:MAG: hypothetical protein U5J82_03495 [Desulfobacterales bacterium]|nr:hypothetical protein [Desulfobacterales bacterium]
MEKERRLMAVSYRILSAPASACGLEKSELMDLSVGDVSKGGKVKDTIQVGKSGITFCQSDQKESLQEHLDSFKKRRNIRGIRPNSYPPNKDNRMVLQRTFG